MPARIVTYAWGAKYVDILTTFALPALLAPGNLPAVASYTSCELVILTEERFFAQLEADRTVCAIKQLCTVRLVSLDDLISNPDRYGISLTYILHRATADLGPAMTEHWFIFLNADFILADQSLKHLLDFFRRGERLVASPSYCVNATDVMPLLRARLDASGTTLALPAREMAKLVLDHRHQTIRGKTLNQSEFHLRYMDQFYWEIDQNTLLGHQMPIAIVGMLPERYLAEPNSYWDYGLMREFCPEAEPCVLGDSDQFLMLELRGNDVAQDQIVSGPVNARDLGERMIIWVTPYQRDFAKYPLTLHAGELPAATEEARAVLAAAKDEILSYAPATLPSHLDHPQWLYHLPGLVEARHAYLSEHLGDVTTHSEPPENYSALDKAWWRLDGCRKAEAQRRLELEGELQCLCLALSDVARESGRTLRTRDPRFAEIVSKPESCPAASRAKGTELAAALLKEFRSVSAAAAATFRRYDQQISALEAEITRAREPFETEYWRLFPRDPNAGTANTTLEIVEQASGPAGWKKWSRHIVDRLARSMR